MSPSRDDAPLLQARLDSAGPGEVVRLAGEFHTTSTLRVRGSLDATGAVLNYSGGGVALEVGSPTDVLSCATVTLPRVLNAGPRWEGVGVRVVNTDTCTITLPRVRCFGVGLDMRGEGRGLAFTTIHLGHLEHNRVNQRLGADDTGWCNQNTIIGGRLAHWSSVGRRAAGVRHVLMVPSPHQVNGNLWLNTSLEGDASEFHVEVAGSYNQFIGCRWEADGGGRIWWRDGSAYNQIVGGYAAHRIVHTRDAGSSRNQVVAPT